MQLYRLAGQAQADGLGQQGRQYGDKEYINSRQAKLVKAEKSCRQQRQHHQ